MNFPNATIRRISVIGPTGMGRDLEGVKYTDDGVPFIPELWLKEPMMLFSIPDFLNPTDDKTKLGYDGIFHGMDPTDQNLRNDDVRFTKSGSLNGNLIVAFQDTPDHTKAVEAGINSVVDTSREVAIRALKKKVVNMVKNYRGWALTYEIKDKHGETEAYKKWIEGLNEIERQLVAYGNLLVATYARNFEVSVANLNTFYYENSNASEVVAFDDI